MFKVRVIPCLDVKDGRVVKGVNFVDLRDAGDPVELAALYDAQGADELTFLDISASHQGRATTLEAQGRHDPCVLPRAVPMVEAMVCLVLADHWLRQRAVDALPR